MNESETSATTERFLVKEEDEAGRLLDQETCNFGKKKKRKTCITKGNGSVGVNYDRFWGVRTRIVGKKCIDSKIIF